MGQHKGHALVVLDVEGPTMVDTPPAAVEGPAMSDAPPATVEGPAMSDGPPATVDGAALTVPLLPKELDSRRSRHCRRLYPLTSGRLEVQMRLVHFPSPKWLDNLRRF